MILASKLLDIMFVSRAVHYVVIISENKNAECVGRVSNLKKLAVVFA